ncbi:sodium-independent anion transporter [Comamonadaceae bacterium M7527]|nr:sodium-independent anion transporter [Comamonadaceae bacterium M7527]
MTATKAPAPDNGSDQTRAGSHWHIPRLQFSPRVLWHLKHYGRANALKDIGSGITVGIVALPLAMAFAIASGLSPEAGLWTAIIGGFLVAALGGSSVQIGGPAGAFIVIVYGIVQQHGVGSLLVSTSCAGLLLFVMGWLKLGSLVRYVPVSVVIGFTNGIAVLIAVSQLRDWLGLDVPNMPADFFSQMQVLVTHLHSFNPYAFALTSACVVGLFAWSRIWQQLKNTPLSALQNLQHLPGASRALNVTARLPGPIVALVSLSALAYVLQLPVETIGQRFGRIPSGLPAFALPDFSWASVKQLVLPTITIAMLGAVESLLCARVADQLIELPKHNPNQELMAQGVANFSVPFFGGMPVTGTIARTVTNIRAGATSPVSGMVHALTLCAIVLLAAPLAVHIPLAVLAGILLFVAWNMGEWREFAKLKHFSGHYRLMLLSTFFVTVVFDLTLAVQLGLAMAFVLFIKRQSDIFQVRIEQTTPSRVDVVTYGSLFFGAVGKLDTLGELARNAPSGCAVHLHAQRLIALDTTGLDGLKEIAHTLHKHGCTLHMHQLQAQPLSLLQRSGFLAELHSWDAEHSSPSAVTPT